MYWLLNHIFLSEFWIKSIALQKKCGQWSQAKRICKINSVKKHLFSSQLCLPFDLFENSLETTMADAWEVGPHRAVANTLLFCFVIGVFQMRIEVSQAKITFSDFKQFLMLLLREREKKTNLQTKRFWPKEKQRKKVDAWEKKNAGHEGLWLWRPLPLTCFSICSFSMRTHFPMKCPTSNLMMMKLLAIFYRTFIMFKWEKQINFWRMGASERERGRQNVHEVDAHFHGSSFNHP